MWLIILSVQPLIIAFLNYFLINADLLLLLILQGINSLLPLLFPSQEQVLTRYSPIPHWKYHLPFGLHVLSMLPAFILSLDRTLDENCLSFQDVACIHALHIRLASRLCSERWIPFLLSEMAKQLTLFDGFNIVLVLEEFVFIARHQPFPI